MPNSVFFFPARSIKPQIMGDNVLYASNNKIHIKALREELRGFDSEISLTKHMPDY